MGKWRYKIKFSNSASELEGKD